MKPPALAVGLLFAFSFGPILPAFAAEHPVTADAVPKSARDAVKKKYPSARVVGDAREHERGTLRYEINLDLNGRSIDVVTSPDGRIESEERRIARTELPAAVLDAFANSKIGTSDLLRIERIVEHEAEDDPRFELLVRNRRGLWELTYDRSGRLLTKERVRSAD